MQRKKTKLQKEEINANNIKPFQGLTSFFSFLPPVAPGVIHIQPLSWLRMFNTMYKLYKHNCSNQIRKPISDYQLFIKI